MSVPVGLGYFNNPSRKWTPQGELTGPNQGWALQGEYACDPYLAGLQSDPYNPAVQIVIPMGRIVSIGNCQSVNGGTNGYRFNGTTTGKTSVTLHDGNYLTPVGVSVNTIFKDSAGNWAGQDMNTCKFKKGALMELPYDASVVNAHGTVNAGDRITGYPGSVTTSTPLTSLHRGKPVLWNPKKLYSVSMTAGTTATLSEAIYPGITPRLVAAFNGSTYVSGSAATTAWSSANSRWQMTFGQNVTVVWYEWGQTAEQIAGEAIRIQPISDILAGDEFAKYVEYPMDFINYPPFARRTAVTTVGSGTNPVNGSGWETPTTVTANVSYQTSNANLSVNHPVRVQIQGTVMDTQGNTYTYSGAAASGWYELPYNSTNGMAGYFTGQYHRVSWQTGLIELSPNIVSVTAIKVLYSYISDPRDGAVLWGAGIQGLTDGGNVSNQYGTPAHLNYLNTTGAFRAFIY